ncbi:hypothetical protein [Paraburkholderia acidisoli]|uniref:Uncharacterized protein n=1 Tax=Paraburkholderia acidisoli TaxID=2571748 RepID=A0A7Z2JKD3_9BURK|nr:hypothetical protein [Paraburkholderia acidisoli]QGZ66245.1 hypothetical protein FAZ98_31065 [Paraburkholderia acidisoli]QGZ66335.1 hypothetical protein FAZ98_31570 [Paraburkholderia acidisoli]
MTDEEYREHVRSALLDGLMQFEGSAYNEETKQAMLEMIIDVWPPRPPVNWIEAVEIKSGALHYTLTREAAELLRKPEWEEVDAQPKSAV